MSEQENQKVTAESLREAFEGKQIHQDSDDDVGNKKKKNRR